MYIIIASLHNILLKPFLKNSNTPVDWIVNVFKDIVLVYSEEESPTDFWHPGFPWGVFSNRGLYLANPLTPAYCFKSERVQSGIKVRTRPRGRHWSGRDVTVTSSTSTMPLPPRQRVLDQYYINLLTWLCRRNG